MERAVRTAAADKPAASKVSISEVVATNAGRAAVGSGSGFVLELFDKD
jgi:hypothetical protein